MESEQRTAGAGERRKVAPPPPTASGRAGLGLVACDLVLSFMWVCSGALIKLFVFHHLGLALQPRGEALKAFLSVASMFFFAWLGHFTGGGAYNPLTVLVAAISGDFARFVVTVFGRIPAQMVGSIIGVKLLVKVFPQIGRGPRLNVDIHQGALTEGTLTFLIVMISQGLKKNNSRGFFLKTWISSVSKLSLHILGSDLTGGCMNPASALGWAYVRGDHISKEHIYVYWLAPLEAMLLGVWTFSLLAPSRKQKEVNEKSSQKTKSE